MHLAERQILGYRGRSSPRVLGEMVNDRDTEKSRRVMKAMIQN